MTKYVLIWLGLSLLTLAWVIWRARREYIKKFGYS